MTTGERELTALLDRCSARDDTGAVSFQLASPSRDWTFAYESEASPKPYFIASITKLYTTAVILQLHNEGTLELDARIARYLDADILAGLHEYHGTEHSTAITVRQLLAHTSGIADYFGQKRERGGTVIGDALQTDTGWRFEDALIIAKTEMSPRFAPGTPGKAFYSDTNYQLLGRIIANLTGHSWEQAVTERIIRPLHLIGTWPFDADTVDRYDQVASLRYGRKVVHLPRTLASVGAQGSIVSTAADGVTFLRAFNEGKLFPSEYLAELQGEWRRIFYPLQYGTGLMRYRIPRLLSPGSGPREFIGHSGSSGSVLFYAPSHDLYLSGTVNQLKNRALVYRLTARLAALAA